MDTDTLEQDEPGLENYEVLRPALKLFAFKFAQASLAEEMLELVRQAEDSFRELVSSLEGGVLEERRVWADEEERAVTGFSPQRFARSIAIGLPSVRLENGEREFYIPQSVGLFHPARSLLHIQPALSEGNNLEEAWVVCKDGRETTRGKPFKPWRVRSRETSFQPNGLERIVQGWYSPGLQWRHGCVQKGAPIGTWYVLVGSPSEYLRDDKPTEVVVVGGRRYLIDRRTASHCGIDNPSGGLESAQVRVYRCACSVSWRNAWYVARTSSRQIFEGSTDDLRRITEFACLKEAALAVDQKCHLCIPGGCYRPHLAVANPSIGFDGYCGCDGMPLRAP